MPLSGGTSGAHDDSMHQGSAKRDVNSGVAGLDAWGSLLAVGASMIVARDAADKMYIHERASGEIAQYWLRVGANDYLAYIECGGVWEVMQSANMKDVVNGIAALDAAGALLVPGSKMYYTRDGSDDVHIYERTSDEEAYAFHRVGANDYTFFVKESNVWKRMQTESMKDVANGIAGLDANVQLDIEQMRPSFEEYSNHLGAVDNFTETVTAGNGTANTDAANHRMDLSGGTGATGHGIFRSKSQYTPAAKPIVVNFKIDNIINGVGGSRISWFGMSADFTNTISDHRALFRQLVDDSWDVVTYGVAAEEATAISALANGDLCSIVVTTSDVRFYVNGVIVATHSTQLPTGAMNVGGTAYGAVTLVTTAREFSIDMMSMKRYV